MTTLDDKILDYLTGALDPEEVASVEAMIQADPALEAEVQFHRQILGASEGISMEEPPLELSVSLMDAALDEMTRDKRRPPKARSFWEQFFITFTQPTLVGSMAVIMVAVVSVGLWRSLELPEEVTTVDDSTLVRLEEVDHAPEAQAEREVEVAPTIEKETLVAEATPEDDWVQEDSAQLDSIQREPNEKVERASRRVRKAVPKSNRPKKVKAIEKAPEAPEAAGALAQLDSAPKPVAPVGGLVRRGRGRTISGSGFSSGRIRTAKPGVRPPSTIPRASSGSSASSQSEVSADTAESKAEQKALLHASSADLPVGYYERRPAFWAARAKARTSEKPGAELDSAPWEKVLVRMIQNHGSKKAVQRARAYLKESPELMKQAHFVYLYAEVLFGSGDVGLAKKLAMSIRGENPYGHVVEMLLEAIAKSEE